MNWLAILVFLLILAIVTPFAIRSADKERGEKQPDRPKEPEPQPEPEPTTIVVPKQELDNLIQEASGPIQEFLQRLEEKMKANEVVLKFRSPRGKDNFFAGELDGRAVILRCSCSHGLPPFGLRIAVSIDGLEIPEEITRPFSERVHKILTDLYVSVDKIAEAEKVILLSKSLQNPKSLPGGK